MDMPSYDQYGKWFGDGPMSLHYGMQQMDLAKQFQYQKYLQEQEATKKASLQNLFDEQNNPLRIQSQEISNRKLGYEADDAGVKSRINVATEGLQLDAKQKEFIQKAKQSDLDMMEIEGQRMAYSMHPDPNIRAQERAQGEQLLKMHKDFVKLREEGKIRSDLEKQKFGYDLELEKRRAANAQALAQTRASAKTGGIKSVYDAVMSGKVSPDKAAAAFGAAALQAEVEGDMNAAAEYRNAAATMEKLATTTKPDAMVGKPDVGAMGGIPTTPPRQPTFTPQQTAPAQKPASLADVQKLYPGVPADKLKQAYKNKFGVDLQ